MTVRLNLTQDPEADALLSEDPFALLTGMLLDQSINTRYPFALLVGMLLDQQIATH